MIKKNLDAIKDNYPEIWAKLEEQETFDHDEVTIESSRNGEAIVCYHSNQKDVYLNSKYNPSVEAERFLEGETNVAEESFVCFFGLANGLFAERMLNEATNNPRILIYEPCRAVFETVISKIDITQLIENEKVYIVVNELNEERLMIFLHYNIRPHNRNYNKFIVLPKYNELFPEQLLVFERAVKETMINVQTTMNTGTRYGEMILKNVLMNTRFLKGCRSGRQMLNAFPQDMPAVVVSAGPSLKKNIHLLKKAKGRALIAVVDRTIKSVMEVGIVPDVIFALDFLKPVELFDVPGIEDIPIVIDPAFNYKVIEKIKPKNLIFYGADDNLYEDMFKRADCPFWNVDTGESVATMAIANLIAWGFKKIVLIGQDLALTENTVHYMGGKEDAIDMTVTMHVEGIKEKEVLTRTDFLTYIRWIERVAYNNKEVEIIDSTEGGAKKKNTTILSFQEAIDAYMKNTYDVESYIRNIPLCFTGDSEKILNDKYSEMKANLKKLRKQLKEASSSCREGIGMLEAGDIQIRKLKDINARIRKADASILNAEEYSLLEKLVIKNEYDLVEDLFDDFDDDKAEAIRMYQKSLNYYDAIIERIPDLIQLIEETEQNA